MSRRHACRWVIIGFGAHCLWANGHNTQEHLPISALMAGRRMAGVTLLRVCTSQPCHAAHSTSCDRKRLSVQLRLQRSWQSAPIPLGSAVQLQSGSSSKRSYLAVLGRVLHKDPSLHIVLHSRGRPDGSVDPCRAAVLRCAVLCAQGRRRSAARRWPWAPGRWGCTCLRCQAYARSPARWWGARSSPAGAAHQLRHAFAPLKLPSCGCSPVRCLTAAAVAGGAVLAAVPVGERWQCQVQGEQGTGEL
jgi:hypothetical protein